MRSFYRSTRSLHQYLGLFAGPFVLVYAVSAILLNHAIMPWGGRGGQPSAPRIVRVALRDAEDGLVLAAQVRQQVGIRGEIGYVSRKPGSQQVNFPIESPGRVANVRVDIATGLATVEQRETGVWDGLAYLHTMPGPHNVSIRGNWAFTRLWGWLADGSVYLILFLSASGVYLWTVAKAERRTGLIVLGTGMLSFLALVLAVAA